MKYKAEDLLKNGKIGTKQLAEITGDNRSVVLLIVHTITKALHIDIRDTITNEANANGKVDTDVYLDKELLECYLVMAPMIKKQRAIRAEAETKRLKDAGLI